MAAVQPQVQPQAPPQPPPPAVSYAPPPPPARDSLLSKMKRSCAGNPGLYLAVIAVLVAIVIYLFALRRGWIGGEGTAPGEKKTKKTGAVKSGKNGKASQDNEVEDLIAALES